MHAGTACIVFAKAPLAGQAKTRLIPALGAEGAARLAMRMLEHTVAQAVHAGFEQVELCVTPVLALPVLDSLVGRYSIALTLQSEGDLGVRMNNALARALTTRAHAVLIGTDVPATSAALLRQAAAALQEHDAVFVPTYDGGYALVGLNVAAPALFTDIAWSTPSVMATTRERARASGMKWVELDAVADVDEPEDLVHVPGDWLASDPPPAPA